MLSSCKYVGSNKWLCKNKFEEITIGAIVAFSLDGSFANEPTSSAAINTVKPHGQKLSCFPRGFGSFFPLLNSLTITDCGLTTISRDDLVGLEELKHLDLTSNLLTSLPNDLFIGMEKLKRILFKDNKLDTMSSTLLEPILKNSLTLIDLRGNSKIDVVYSYSFYLQKKSKDMVSLEKLMELIDSQCNKPANDEVHVSSIEYFEKDFAVGFANLWASGEFSDFTIITNGSKEFRVHKTVLAIHSSVFTTMFKNNMEEQQTGKMTISDFSAEAVEQFLACLYTGKIMDVTNAMELFALAAKYDVPKLKAASEKNVLQNIDSSNAYDVFALGHLHSSLAMQRKAFDVIQQTLPGVKLHESLIDDPKRMKILIDAYKLRTRKMHEAEDEFSSICKRSEIHT